MSVYVDYSLKPTYDDLRRIPEDDHYRHEPFDGVHLSTPSPVPRLQELVTEIFGRVHEDIHKPGLVMVFGAPSDVEPSPVRYGGVGGIDETFRRERGPLGGSRVPFDAAGLLVEIDVEALFPQ